MSFFDRDKISHFDHDQRTRRRSQLLRAVLLDSSGQSYDIVIRNVSARGIAGIAPGHSLPQAEDVVVLLPDETSLAGNIVWADGEKFGLRLRREIDLTALDGIFGRRQQSTNNEGQWEVLRFHKVVTPPVPSKLRRI